jgi:hypothetical protein
LTNPQLHIINLTTLLFIFFLGSAIISKGADNTQCRLTVIFFFKDVETGGTTMLMSKELERLPEDDRVVTLASYHYYRALLSGAPDCKRQQLRKAWLCEIYKRWPDTATLQSTI